MKNIRTGRHGSIILIVMVIMTFLSGCIITTLIATHQLCSLSHARCVYQQQRALLEGLLQVGVAYCCDNRVDFFSVAKQSRTIRMAFDPWPARELADTIGYYRGAIVLQIVEKMVKIEAQVVNDKITRQGSCMVTLLDENSAVAKDSKLRIRNWTVDA